MDPSDDEKASVRRKRNEDLRQRTKAFALRIVRPVESPRASLPTQVMGEQLLRCGTSVAANYRAACRARSTADFIAKMGLVEEEADECSFWIEMLVEGGFIKQNPVEDLLKEGNELRAIVISSIITARGSKRNSALRTSLSAVK
jgi:four helix bundle protein